MVQVAARRLRAAGSALYEAARQTHAARLAIMATRLKSETPLVAVLVGAILIFCLYLGWSTGRSVHGVLLPASPTGIGATIAGVIAGLAALELTAAFAVTLMTAGLQLAYDTGRHCVLALLAIASAFALAGLAWRLWEIETAALAGTILPVLGTAGLVMLTLWFERAYLRPAYPGFRDFWVDVVDARHFLMRSAHGE
jgi:hypothetical protein